MCVPPWAPTCVPVESWANSYLSPESEQIPCLVSEGFVAHLLGALLAGAGYRWSKANLCALSPGKKCLVLCRWGLVPPSPQACLGLGTNWVVQGSPPSLIQPCVISPGKGWFACRCTKIKGSDMPLNLQNELDVTPWLWWFVVGDTVSTLATPAAEVRRCWGPMTAAPVTPSCLGFLGLESCAPALWSKWWLNSWVLSSGASVLMEAAWGGVGFLRPQWGVGPSRDCSRVQTSSQLLRACSPPFPSRFPCRALQTPLVSWETVQRLWVSLHPDQSQNGPHHQQGS